MPSERENRLSDEKLEARALAYREGCDALNLLAGQAEDPVEQEEFYRLGKKLWIEHRRLTTIKKERKDGQGT